MPFLMSVEEKTKKRIPRLDIQKHVEETTYEDWVSYFMEAKNLESELYEPLEKAMRTPLRMNMKLKDATSRVTCLRVISRICWMSTAMNIPR